MNLTNSSHCDSFLVIETINRFSWTSFKGEVIYNKCIRSDPTTNQLAKLSTFCDDIITPCQPISTIAASLIISDPNLRTPYKASNPSINMAEESKQIDIAPAVPIQYVIDTRARIKELGSFLDPNNPKYEPERQHYNIRAAIKLYEEGKIDGIQHTFIVNGEVTPFKDIVKPGAPAMWVEVRYS